MVQQHSLDQVVVYKYPSYQWDHAVTLSVERREEGRRGEKRGGEERRGEERRGERKRARREIAHIYRSTLLYVICQLQHTHTQHTQSVYLIIGIRRLSK